LIQKYQKQIIKFSSLSTFLPKDDAQLVTLVFFLNRRGRAMGWVGVRSNPKNQPDGNPVKHSVLGPIFKNRPRTLCFTGFCWPTKPARNLPVQLYSESFNKYLLKDLLYEIAKIGF
jgi:hypothetical protein